MEDPALPQIQRLLAARTGLHIRQRDREHFLSTLAARVRSLKLASCADYRRLLEGNTDAASLEWRRLIALLTNRESYFFRDKGQMALLKERILPELLERNRRSKTLRLWSAGCSTGEEPYSLAILVDEVLPEAKGWTIHLVGSDINEEVLDRARRAVYGRWSFRDVEPERQDRYFREQPDGWMLETRIRSMVTFRRINLLADPFPRDPVSAMDLILCRNVFIYFERDAVTAVLHKFADTLKEGSYLLTGHAEIHALEVGQLKTVRFPQSIAYQRGAAPDNARPAAVTAVRSAATLPAAGVAVERSRAPIAAGGAPAPPVRRPVVPPAPIPVPVLPAVPAGANAGLREAEAAFGAGNYARAAASAEALLRENGDRAPALTLAARSYANLGDHERAAACCRRASAADPLDAAPYRLLATIAEERGDIEEAKRALKKVVYLSPDAVTGYLELGSLHQREGDGERARKLWSSALGLLRGVDPAARVDGYEALTAGELTRQLHALLDRYS